MAPGYLLVEMRITDAERYRSYMAEAQELVRSAGGEYLVRGGRSETLEGTWQPARIAVLRFPSYEKARTFYDSAAYVAARAKRSGATEFFNLVLVEGVDAPV